MKSTRILLATVTTCTLALASLSGCTTTAQRKEIPTPTKTESYPALRTEQVDPVLKAVNAALEAADKSFDPKDLGGRVAGPALEMRSAQYKMHQKNSNSSPTTLPASSELSTVTSGNSWPRSLLNVTGADKNGAKYVEVIRQSKATDPYQLWQWMQLLPKASLPETDVVARGSKTLDLKDSSKLLLSPEKAINTWAATVFDEKAKNADKVFVDPLMEGKREELKSLKEGIGSAGKVATSISPLEMKKNTLAIDLPAKKGALVATTYTQEVQLTEVASDKPITLSGDVVNLLDDGKVKEKATWNRVICVLLQIPPKNTKGGKIRVVAASEVLTAASK
ncbi:hypothetical protein [Varibaculum vaginae]|uniref:hypothetical protein n=1 Tax=Varibaculum vaginae TaxID=2364797 RepID=UPI000F0863AB|nr:hypothetical protein [Varibaculum vaginae]